MKTKTHVLLVSSRNHVFFFCVCRERRLNPPITGFGGEKLLINSVGYILQQQRKGQKPHRCPLDTDERSSRYLSLTTGRGARSAEWLHSSEMETASGVNLEQSPLCDARKARHRGIEGIGRTGRRRSKMRRLHWQCRCRYGCWWELFLLLLLVVVVVVVVVVVAAIVVVAIVVLLLLFVSCVAVAAAAAAAAIVVVAFVVGRGGGGNGGGCGARGVLTMLASIVVVVVRVVSMVGVSCNGIGVGGGGGGGDDGVGINADGGGGYGRGRLWECAVLALFQTMRRYHRGDRLTRAADYAPPGQGASTAEAVPSRIGRGEHDQVTRKQRTERWPSSRGNMNTA